jgi:hypothetical protein
MARLSFFAAELLYFAGFSCRPHEKTLTDFRAGCKNAAYHPVSA